MCVYTEYHIQSLYALKIYKAYLHIFVISIQQIYTNQLSLREKILFFLKLARKESKVDLTESKSHYFPECTRLFPSHYCLCQKEPGSSLFLKNSPLLFYHIFLKFHKNMIVFFKRMSFGNSHELIIKCLMFSFSVISYLSFFSFSPCFFPLFFISIMGP